MARKATRRKKRKKAKVNSKNITNRFMVACSFLIILFILVVGLSYYLFGYSFFKLGVNSTTANNISFNDFFDSDTIMINNINKLSDNYGKMIKPIELKIDGENDNLEYEILLIPINVNIDLKDIKYYLTDKDDNVIGFNNLANVESNDDYSGLVIYRGIIKNKNDIFNLRIWIDKNYKGDINNNSFEVKVKLK